MSDEKVKNIRLNGVNHISDSKTAEDCHRAGKQEKRTKIDQPVLLKKTMI